MVFSQRGDVPTQPTLFDPPAPAGAGSASGAPAPASSRSGPPAAGTERERPAGSAREATAWPDLPRACFDLETTGRDPHTARIVTASVVLVAPDGTVEHEWEWLADPGVEIPEEAAAVHGVDTATARAQGQPAHVVVRQLHETLTGLWGQATPVLAFNAAYDLTVLTRECERHGLPAPEPFPVLDPFILNKHVHRYRKGPRTLGALCEEYRVTLDAAHTSAADALATERLLVAMTERYEALRRPAAQLHRAQIGWAAEQAASLQEHFRKRNPHAVVDGTWPVHPAP